MLPLASFTILVNDDDDDHVDDDDDQHTHTRTTTVLESGPYCCQATKTFIALQMIPSNGRLTHYIPIYI